MAFFNEFPHTRTYDSDLAWLIARMKEIKSRMTGVEDRMKALEKLISDFINEANIPQIIKDYIQELIENGEIGKIVEEKILELLITDSWTRVLYMNNTAWKTSLFTRSGLEDMRQRYKSGLGISNLSFYKANNRKKLVLEIGSTRMGLTGSTIDTISATNNKLLFEFICESGSPSVEEIDFPFIGENVESLGVWNMDTATVTCSFGSAAINTGYLGSSASKGFLRSINVLAIPTNFNRAIPHVITIEDYDVYD